MKKGKGVEVSRFFTKTGDEGFEKVETSRRNLTIKNPQTGKIVFEGKDLEFPKNWSENCCTIVAEKYFRKVKTDRGTSYQEESALDMVSRVVNTVVKWGMNHQYFATNVDALAFSAELKHILINQKAAFNSPVWFNVGTNKGEENTEQISACFLVGLEDTMDAILDVAQVEGRLYKGGSGSGINYSNLRSSKEPLSGGGYASGPVSFMKKDDANAGAIKSGGTTRRAAKISILEVDHGDIFEFIQCKQKAEEAAYALIDGGFSSDFRDEWGAYGLVPFQNANHTVRVTDAFMEAVLNDEMWELKARDGSVLEKVKAKDVFNRICEAAWSCGDPGVQFHDTINAWHTSPLEGEIRTSNPCGEFVYLDWTSCNLASINLLKYLNEDGSFDVDAFIHTVNILILAMDILIAGGGFPDERIARMSRKYRPLGLGYSSLGGFLMAKGLAYNSCEGRSWAAAITALMTGFAYVQSSKLAEGLGSFEGFSQNAPAVFDVINKHHSYVDENWIEVVGPYMYTRIEHSWNLARTLVPMKGLRNGQLTLLAPTGTISFLMDCPTTGIEPDISIKKYKKLVGGGTMEIPSPMIRPALEALNYMDTEIKQIEQWVIDTGSIVGAPYVDVEDYAVFDCALAEPVEGRCISPYGHIDMMAAVQPFLSGAISKTCNVPNDFSVEDIGDLYTYAWNKGLKSVTVYRDGCKRTQPLSTTKEETLLKSENPSPTVLQKRKKLSDDCVSIRHKLSIGGFEGYMHVGFYEDGKPGEVWMRMGDVGSTVQGLLDSVAVLTSLSLQYGVPLEDLVNKFSFSKFEPNGITSNPDIRIAHSVVDYMFRFLGRYNKAPVGGVLNLHKTSHTSQKLAEVKKEWAEGADPLTDSWEKKLEIQNSGQLCDRCGNQTQRAGACMTCSTCGWTSGCG